MGEQNRRYVLRQRPTGRITPETFALITEPVPQIREGQALVRVLYISLDPANRGYLRDAPSYLPPVGLGEVMRAGGVGRVVASKHPHWSEGQLVGGMLGWQEWAVVDDSTLLTPVPDVPGVPVTTRAWVLGVIGLTAWYGVREIGRPRAGETLVVSAAAGAVGSLAGQIAKLVGARVVGIAGGPDKCQLLTKQLHFDAAVDRTAANWREQLAAATPDGVDVDFENVGGQIMDAVFDRLNLHARVVLCGLISAYNDTEPPPGPRNFPALLIQRVRLQGFIVLDHLDRAAEAAAELAGWLATGQLHAQETVVEGFEQLPTAINMLFDGANVGKLLVRLNPQ